MSKHVVYVFHFKSLYVVSHRYGEDKDNILYENLKAWLKMFSSAIPFFLPSSIYDPFCCPSCFLKDNLIITALKLEELPTGNF